MFSVQFHPASLACIVFAHSQDSAPTRTVTTVPTPLSPISDASSSPRATKEPWEPQWAQAFIKMMPTSDADWNSQVASNTEVNNLFRKLTLSHLSAARRARMDWPDLFDKCVAHMVRIKNSLPLASFFSFVFIATCHIAFVDGCSEELILEAMRACLEVSSNSVNYYDDITLEEVRKGALVAIQLLNECVGVLGYRAYELPLHLPTRLPISIYCDPISLKGIMDHLPFTYHPTTPLQSECLFMPSLVYELLGGSKSRWSYEYIQNTLAPEIVQLPSRVDFDMGSLLEPDQFDESD